MKIAIAFTPHEDTAKSFKILLEKEFPNNKFEIIVPSAKKKDFTLACKGNVSDYMIDIMISFARGAFAGLNTLKILP